AWYFSIHGQNGRRARASSEGRSGHGVETTGNSMTHHTLLHTISHFIVYALHCQSRRTSLAGRETCTLYGWSRAGGCMARCGGCGGRGGLGRGGGGGGGGKRQPARGGEREGLPPVGAKALRRRAGALR